MEKWNDILKIKVEDSPIGDMEQYERDAVRSDSELDDYRYEGWPTNKQELKEQLEEDMERLATLSEFYKILGNQEMSKKWMDEVMDYATLVKDIDKNFPEDKLTGITQRDSPYNRAMEMPYWPEWNRLDEIKRLLNRRSPRHIKDNRTIGQKAMQDFDRPAYM